jgi:hypothetical protein
VCFTRRSLSLSTIYEKLGIEMGEALDKRLSDDDDDDDDDKKSRLIRPRPIRHKAKSIAAALNNRPDTERRRRKVELSASFGLELNPAPWHSPLSAKDSETSYLTGHCALGTSSVPP